MRKFNLRYNRVHAPFSAKGDERLAWQAGYAFLVFNFAFWVAVAHATQGLLP